MRVVLVFEQKITSDGSIIILNRGVNVCLNSEDKRGRDYELKINHVYQKHHKQATQEAVL